jgi:predicted RNA-binding protein with TRAM domain
MIVLLRHEKPLKTEKTEKTGGDMVVDVVVVIITIEVETSKPPIEVGKEYEVDITEISRQGDGIARIQGFVIFVKWGGKVGKKVKIRAMEVGSKFAIATIVY